MDEKLGRITQRIDDTAITRYKHKLDKKYPIRERDLRFPGRASLLGCIWTKLAMILVITAYLIMHSAGLDDGQSLDDPLAPMLLVGDVAIGCCVYGIASVFTYFYIRIKNLAFAILLFLACCAAVVLAFLIWSVTAPSGGLNPVLSGILIATGVIPLVADIWGFITYDQKVAQGKIL